MPFVSTHGLFRSETDYRCGAISRLLLAVPFLQVNHLMRLLAFSLVSHLPAYAFMRAHGITFEHSTEGNGISPVPKPRSIQSRFILMEGGTVLLALVLMVGALILSVRIRSQFSTGVEGLHQQIALLSRIHAAFDRTVLSFWRYQASSDAALLLQYRGASTELRSLTGQSLATISSPKSRQEAEKLVEMENTILDLTNEVVEAPKPSKAKARALTEIPKREVAVRNAFSTTAEEQFKKLNEATARLAMYTQVLRVVLLILGLFPVVVMLWFRRAHERHIWTPLERLHGMVLEVKRGNLEVDGAVPETVELGSVTSAFLVMASELREMRNSLEEKVRQRAAQLEAASKDLLRAAKLASLGQLVAGVAHEINNPLTSILGFSEIVLTNTELDERVVKQVRTMRDEALRLKHLVANLNQFARRTPQQAHSIDLRTVPDRLLELRAYQLAANNIRVEYCRPEKPIWINGDRDSLLQLMLQLVLNAEHAIHEGRESGEIHLKCEASDDYAMISIDDNGCGMSAEMREHIFDPFFTTRPSRHRTGLGLSVCHGIVEQHGGDVTVHSEIGHGTSFRIRLPLTQGTSPEKPAPNRAKNLASRKGLKLRDASTRSKRFLVIDDEADILNLVAEVLGGTETKIVTLQDSNRLDSVLDEAFDAVLCDLKMPGRDGLSVLRTVREVRPDLARRFLLMTGNLADADKAAVELEGIPILPKPFTLSGLLEMIEQVTTNSE